MISKRYRGRNFIPSEHPRCSAGADAAVDEWAASRRVASRRAARRAWVRVRVHIRGTLNQAAFVAREPKSSADSRARSAKVYPKFSPFFLLAAAKREQRSFLPSSFSRSLAPELPEATETDGRRCVYY